MPAFKVFDTQGPRGFSMVFANGHEASVAFGFMSDSDFGMTTADVAHYVNDELVMVNDDEPDQKGRLTPEQVVTEMFRIASL